MKNIKLFCWYIFIIISFFYCYEFFLRISPGILVQQLLTQYQASALDIGAFASSYYCGYVLMQIPAGVLYDRYPFKWVVFWALLTCVVGSIIFVLGEHVYVGILGRFLLGCGSAFAFVGAVTFIKKYLPEKHFTLLVALVISLSTIFAAFGQVFAVRFIQYVSWHHAIESTAAWGVILAVAIAVVPQRYFQAIDDMPIVTWQCIVMQFKRICKMPIVWLNGVIGSLFYLPTSIIAATWGVELFTKQYYFTKTQGSYAITWLFVGWAVGGPIFGWLVDKIGCEKLIISNAAGVAVIILTYVLFGFRISADMLYVCLFIFGLASSAQVLVWHIFSMAISDKRITGTAVAFTNLLIMLSIAIWDLVLGKVIDTLHHSFSATTGEFTAFDLRMALLSLPILIAMVIILAQFLPGLINHKKHT